MGDGNFRSPTESIPLNQSPKKLVQVTSRRPLRLCQIWCKSAHGGLLGKLGWNITNFFNLYLFFRELTYRSDPSRDFHAWWLKRRGLAQGCAFWGFQPFRWYCSPFSGSKIPPNPQFWGRGQAFSNQTGEILRVSYYRIYCIDFNQILQNDRDQQVVIVGGPNTRPANSRWRTAAILKTVKSPYLGNRLTDFDEIWQNDA